LARETSCGRSRPAGSWEHPALFHLVERPAIVRSVYDFVKTQTTIYCAFLLGQAQYVGPILP
jgi:hypothetical protein